MINIEHIQRVELRIVEHLAATHERFNQIEKVLLAMAIDLSVLVDEVAKVQSTEASAVALISGISKRLVDAVSDSDSATQAKISELTAELQKATVPLAQAVSDNTPVAPAPAPVVEQVAPAQVLLTETAPEANTAA
jgi:hypothetical protein